MPFVNNLQEMMGSIMIPFALIAGGVALALMILLSAIATMVNALIDN